MRQPIDIVLHSVRSAHNVGSMFRTADGADVRKVYLCGTTPTPYDRFGRIRQDIAKVALGAETTMPWEYGEDVRRVLALLKEEDVYIVAVEQYSKAVPYSTFRLLRPTAFLFGPEVGGIHEDILAMCDACIELPMLGSKESLNVSITCGIVLYHARCNEALD